MAPDWLFGAGGNVLVGMLTLSVAESKRHLYEVDVSGLTVDTCAPDILLLKV